MTMEASMAKLLHTMIRVMDLDRSLGFYRTALGLEPSHRLDFPGFTLVYLRNPETEAELELTWNRDRTEPYTHGTGYGHIAACVPDLAAERDRLLRAGIEAGDIKELRQDGTLLARFFFLTDPDGYKVEVLEAMGHYR